jgi:TRAP-type C4-dicarboxylate transport system permease small subunit
MSLADKQSSRLNKYEKWLESLFIAMAVLGTVSGVLIVGLIGASVTMRYLAYTPFRFTEELVGLLMTAAFSLVLPLITLRSKHVRVLMFLNFMPQGATRIANIIARLFGLIFCLWFFFLCLPWFEFAFDRMIKTEVGRMLMYPWMALMPLSFLLTGLAFVVRGLSDNQRNI